jgi:hypothetical protein
MFIKLRWAYTEQTVVLNFEHVVRFDRGGGWTHVKTIDGAHLEVRETPEEILALLAGGHE